MFISKSLRYEGCNFRHSSTTVSPTTLIRHETKLQTGGIWKCVLVWTQNILKTELLENNGVRIIVWSWSPCWSFPQTQIQNGRWLLCFKFLRRCVNGEHLIRCQFLWLSVDGALEVRIAKRNQGEFSFSSQTSLDLSKWSMWFTV